MSLSPSGSVDPGRSDSAAATPRAAAPDRRPDTGHLPDQLPAVLAGLLAAPAGEPQEQAWGRFVDRYTPLLLHAAHHFSHDYDDVMDRYAYVLDRLRRDEFRRLRAFAAEGPGRFTTWLVVVSRRLVQDYQRERYGRPHPSIPGSGSGPAIAGVMRRNLADMLGEEVPTSCRDERSAASPELLAQTVERAQAVRQAVSKLDPRDQLLLKLRYEDELGGPEIARMMGYPSPFHVYRRLRTLLRLLASRVHREHADAAP